MNTQELQRVDEYINKKIMGIKNLNRFLLDNCKKPSIKKVHLKQLSNKTVVIDTSIYLYKFVAENTLLESMYLFISILKKYGITPIFIFDGKPPPEKKELLIKRKLEKQEAEQKYNEIQKLLQDEEMNPEKKEEVLLEMEILKKQFVRIKDDDIRNVKELMDAYGVTYYESTTEADQLCVHFVQNNKAWACVSDDMDMFLYGCKRVIRHISLLNHTVILYDYDMILNDLKLNLQHFREIMVLSGTDYNIKSETSLYATMKLFNEFRGNDIDDTKSFYQWLKMNTEYIKDEASLMKTYNMFVIENYKFDVPQVESDKKMDIPRLQTLLLNEGFIFPIK